MTGKARRVPPWLLPAGLGAGAVACAAIVSAAGPVRFVAGAVLALYLPGHVAVLSLRRTAGRDTVFAAALVVPLSIAVTAAVGLAVAGAGWPFEPALVGWLLAAVSVPLALVAAWTRRSARARPVTVPRLRHWWAAIPVLALTVLLAVQVIAATRHRTPDSYYTEFATEPSGSVLVHSRERVTTRFRYEVRVGAEIRQSIGFTLRPGERRAFPLDIGPDERADVRLYRADEAAPYRRLTW